MKLDRNINDDEHGKYALVKLRALSDMDDGAPFGGPPEHIRDALQTLVDAGVIDFGNLRTSSEFFVIRLKDKYAAAALAAYAGAAMRDDPEWAAEVSELASRAGSASPWCKQPD